MQETWGSNWKCWTWEKLQKPTTHHYHKISNSHVWPSKNCLHVTRGAKCWGTNFRALISLAHSLKNTHTSPSTILGPHKDFLHTSHILPKYSPYYYLIWAPTNISHISPIIYLGFSHKYYTLYPTYYPTCVFTKNTYHITTKIGPQNHTISTKKPKLIYLVGKTQKAQQNFLQSPLLQDTSKARCYTAP